MNGAFFFTSPPEGEVAPSAARVRGKAGIRSIFRGPLISILTGKLIPNKPAFTPHPALRADLSRKARGEERVIARIGRALRGPGE